MAEGSSWDDMMIAVCQMCLLMTVMERQNTLSGSFSATAAFWLFILLFIKTKDMNSESTPNTNGGVFDSKVWGQRF